MLVSKIKPFKYEHLNCETPIWEVCGGREPCKFPSNNATEQTHDQKQSHQLQQTLQVAGHTKVSRQTNIQPPKIGPLD